MSRTVQKVKYMKKEAAVHGKKFSELKILYHTVKVVKTGKHPVRGHRVFKEESL